MTYTIAVLLLTIVLPASSVIAEHLLSHGDATLMLLVGKWFVFWAAGMRLVLAGLRQLFQPRFTSETILGIKGDGPLPVVRELGVANLAIGTLGIASVANSSFVLPAAIVGAIFYGLAGIRHTTDRHRNPNQNLAMVTDLLVSLVLAAYVGTQVFA